MRWTRATDAEATNMSAKLPDCANATSPTTGKATTTMTIAQKKLAIEGALTPYLSNDNLNKAIRIWEEKYSQQPTFALQRFINEFCDSATLMAQRSQILQSLIRALSGADGRPRDKPMTVTTALSADTMDAGREGRIGCFTQLVETILTRTPGDMHIRIRLFLLENLAPMKLNALAHRALQAWLSQQYRIPADVILDESALRHLVNLVYVSLCEFLGPVKADNLLHEAVLLTEAANNYPVRKLL